MKIIIEWFLFLNLQSYPTSWQTSRSDNTQEDEVYILNTMQYLAINISFNNKGIVLLSFKFKWWISILLLLFQYLVISKLFQYLFLLMMIV